MNREIKDILTKIIDRYEMDIQWLDNDEEYQAYLEIEKVKDYLNINTNILRVEKGKRVNHLDQEPCPVSVKEDKTNA